MRFDFSNLIGERALHVLLGVVPGIAGKPIFGGERDVAGEHEAVPVDDGIERGGGAETGGMLDGPSGEDAATAAAGYEQIVGIDVSFGDHGVDAAVEIVEVIAGICMMDEVGKFFAVTGAAAGIGVEHDVAEGSPDLLFEIKTIAVIPKGSPMNFENERIFLGRIEIGR